MHGSGLQEARKAEGKHSVAHVAFADVPLPFHAPSLSKDQLEGYKPLFTSYLDIQKQLDIEDLNAKEMRGRWKSFVRKWYVSMLLYAEPQRVVRGCKWPPD